MVKTEQSKGCAVISLVALWYIIVTVQIPRVFVRFEKRAQI